MAFNETKAFKNFMAKLYGLGAAVVIVGALFKIMHWPGAGPMLVVGLGTEAVIFIFSAFDKPHAEPDWSLVYPELAGLDEEHGGHGDAHSAEKAKPKAVSTGDSLSQELDKMLTEAKIGPELIQSLGDGMRSLSENATKLSVTAEATTATEGYVSNLSKAAQSVGNLTNVYEETADALKKDVAAAEQYSTSIAKASESALSLSTSYTNAATATEQIEHVTKNLAALNSVYELKIKEISDQHSSENKLNDSIEGFINNLQVSAEDTRKFNEGVNQLAKNIAALNSVYGNMLSAMTNRNA